MRRGGRIPRPRRRRRRRRRRVVTVARVCVAVMMRGEFPAGNCSRNVLRCAALALCCAPVCVLRSDDSAGVW